MQLERHTFLCKMRMILWVLSAVVMVACVNDNLPEDPAPNKSASIQGGSYDLYFRIQYDSDSPNTRANTSGEGSGELDNSAAHGDHEIGTEGNFVLLFGDNPEGGSGNNAYVLQDVLPLVFQDKWSTDGTESLIPNTDNTQNQDELDKSKDELEEGIVEAIFRSRIDVKPNQLPKKCLVILNGLPIYDELSDKLKKSATLEEVLNMKLTDAEEPRNIGFDQNGRFIMTNAAYFKDDRLQIATDLGTLDMDMLEDYLWFDVDDEEKFKELNKDKKIVRIYVERMVAKFSLNIEEKELDNGGKIEKGTYEAADGKEHPCYYFYAQTDRSSTNPADWTSDVVEVFTEFDETTGIQKTEPRKWRARITGWGVNALEKGAYLFKHISNAPDAYSYFSTLNWNWADPARKRTYWAESVNYANSPKSYPWQYRTAIDAVSYPTMQESYGYSYAARKADNLLLNMGYEYYRDLEFARSVYVPENTYDYFTDEGSFEKYLDGRPHLLAGTHIVICAELQIQQEENGPYKTFNGFRDRIGNYYWADNTNKEYNHTLECFIRLMRTFNYYLSSQKEMRYVYYDWGYPNGKGTPGVAYYAKPINVSGDVERKFEIFWEEEPGNTRTAKRMFDDDNKFLLEDYVDQFTNDDDSDVTMTPECFTQAFIKAGDGKVLPWVNGLRIYDVYSETEGRFDVAAIPVYNESDVEIAAMIEEHIAEIQKKVAAAATKDRPFAYFEDNGLKWVNSDVNKEVYYARERDEYRKQLLNGILPTHNVSDNDRRSMLFDWLSSVDFFCDGMMYYAAEVKNPAGEGGTAYNQSPYGTVRNNWYQFNLTGINRVGTSLSEHGEAIVPNVIATNDQISFNVQVIGWTPVDMGNIRLPN